VRSRIDIGVGFETRLEATATAHNAGGFDGMSTDFNCGGDDDTAGSAGVTAVGVATDAGRRSLSRHTPFSGSRRPAPSSSSAAAAAAAAVFGGIVVAVGVGPEREASGIADATGRVGGADDGKFVWASGTGIEVGRLCGASAAPNFFADAAVADANFPAMNCCCCCCCCCCCGGGTPAPERAEVVGTRFGGGKFAAESETLVATAIGGAVLGGGQRSSPTGGGGTFSAE
jgi:hypothetical protein